MSTTRWPKHRAQRAHAKRRLRERYGLTVNRHDLCALVSLIQGGQGRMVLRQSNRVTVWEVPFQDQLLRVVYDSLRHEIVTALPMTPEEPCSP